MDAFELLQKRMRRAKKYEEPVILLGVYKELVERKKYEKVYEEPKLDESDKKISGEREITYVPHPRQGKGEYRRYMEASDGNRKKIGTYVYEKLIFHGADHCAQRLYEQVLKDLVE